MHAFFSAERCQIPSLPCSYSSEGGGGKEESAIGTQEAIYKHACQVRRKEGRGMHACCYHALYHACHAWAANFRRWRNSACFRRRHTYLLTVHLYTILYYLSSMLWGEEAAAHHCMGYAYLRLGRQDRLVGNRGLSGRGRKGGITPLQHHGRGKGEEVCVEGGRSASVPPNFLGLPLWRKCWHTSTASAAWENSPCLAFHAVLLLPIGVETNICSCPLCCCLLMPLHLPAYAVEKGQLEKEEEG